MTDEEPLDIPPELMTPDPFGMTPIVDSQGSPPPIPDLPRKRRHRPVRRRQIPPNLPRKPDPISSPSAPKQEQDQAQAQETAPGAAPEEAHEPPAAPMAAAHEEMIDLQALATPVGADTVAEPSERIDAETTQPEAEPELARQPELASEPEREPDAGPDAERDVECELDLPSGPEGECKPEPEREPEPEPQAEPDPTFSDELASVIDEIAASDVASAGASPSGFAEHTAMPTLLELPHDLSPTPHLFPSIEAEPALGNEPGPGAQDRVADEPIPMEPLLDPFAASLTAAPAAEIDLEPPPVHIESPEVQSLLSAISAADQIAQRRERHPVRLIAVDLDGTLLDASKRISEQTLKAFRRLAKDVTVVIASARPPRSVRHIYQQLALDTWQINYNGALIWDERSQQAVYHKPIKGELAREMIAIAREIHDGVLVSCEVLDRWYTDREDQTYTTETGRLFKPDVIAPINEICQRDITKLMFLGPPAVMQRIDPILIERFGKKVRSVRTDADLIQIMHYRVGKSRALQRVAEHYGVPLSEVMAIGDAPNDVGMLQLAGVAIAMDNAHARVKRVADWVAPSNNDHGVHAALRRYGLCE